MGEWRKQAACRGMDPAMFFPERGDGKTGEAATGVCSACPVREDCLHFALSHSEKHGVWGGVSERQRRQLRIDYPRACARCEALFPHTNGGEQLCRACAMRPGSRGPEKMDRGTRCSVCGETSCSSWVCPSIARRRQTERLLADEDAA